MASKLETMHPAWFAAGLSSAGVSLMLLFDPIAASEIDKQFGLTLAVLTPLFLLLAIGFMLARFFSYREAFLTDFRHPNFGPLFAAAPAGLMVYSIVLGELMNQEILSRSQFESLTMALIALGTLGTLFIGFTFYLHVVDKVDLPLPAMNGSWFIPVVPLILIPNALIRISKGHQDNLEMLRSFSLLSLMALGAGLALFFMLAAIIGYRLLTLPPPPAHAVATWWIWLAPIGVGGLGILASFKTLESLTGAESLVSISMMLTTSFWGFGIWWLLFAMFSTWRVRKEIHFHLGLWGFGFPLAAFTSLTIQINREFWNLNSLENLAAGLAITTSLIYLILSVQTIQAALNGKAFNRA